MNPPSRKGVYHRENQKIHQKFHHLLKANLILLANTPTPPSQYIDFWHCPVSLRVTTNRPVACCIWSTEPALRKHSCNNIKCTPANARAMKFANYLYLQTEHLLEAC